MAISSYSPGGNSGSRVLRVAELALMICSFSNKRDYVNLLYLCRDAYVTILPLVWEEVDLIWVLHLIPELKYDGYQLESPKPYRSFYFGTIVNLARFNVHSPLVKILRTGNITSIRFPNKWPAFKSLSEPSPLLPNLQRLIVNDICILFDYPWIFLTPNLLELRMIDEKSEKYEDDARNQISQCDAELDAHSCAYLIDWISHSCPRLEKLRLFPSNQSSTPNKLAHSAYDNLANLTNLRSFTLVMSDVYDNVFQALDQLPHLEELILIGTSQCLSAPDPITLADGSFPHLQYLGLYGLCESSTARICKAAPLFRHLIKVDVIYSEPDAESFMDYDRTIAALESIGHNTPHLKDITIYPRGNYGYFVAILPVVDLFKQMSLTRLDLGYTIFNPQEVGYDEGDWGYEGDEVTRNSSLEAQWTAFLSAVPRLEELRLEQQGFWEVQLERMASLLPNLRLLVAQIVWFVGPSEEVNASQTIVIRSQLHLYPHQSIPEIVANVYRLWPNAIWEPNAAESESDQEWANCTPAELNDALRVLRSKAK